MRYYNASAQRTVRVTRTGYGPSAMEALLLTDIYMWLFEESNPRAYQRIFDSLSGAKVTDEYAYDGLSPSEYRLITGLLDWWIADGDDFHSESYVAVNINAGRALVVTY